MNINIIIIAINIITIIIITNIIIIIIITINTISIIINCIINLKGNFRGINKNQKNSLNISYNIDII